MKLRTITNSLLTILTVIVLLFVLLNVLSAPQGKGLLGFKGYTVLSNSMTPTFRAGDYVIDRMDDFDSIQERDIISYQAEDQTIVTHRVIESQRNLRQSKETKMRPLIKKRSRKAIILARKSWSSLF